MENYITLLRRLCWVSVICLIVTIIFWGWQRDYFNWGVTIDNEVLGQYGDFIGGILGTLFALISIMLLISTLRLQKEANDTQDRTLRDQQQMAELQRFNDLFATLLDIYDKTYKELNSLTGGDDFFDVYKRKLKEKFQPQRAYSLSRKQACFDYLKVYTEYKSHLAIYYRSLYRIFDLIDEAHISEDSKREYAKIIRARLTESQLFFLRYNGMSPLGKKFITYINKYNILKHLPIFELLEFKSWWDDLSPDQRNGIETLFSIIQRDIRHKENLNQYLQAHRKFMFYYNHIIESQLVIVITINLTITPVQHDHIDTGFQVLLSKGHEKIESLFECWLKEFIVISNFNKLNDRKTLDFPEAYYREDGQQGTMLVSVRNINDEPLIFSDHNIV